MKILIYDVETAQKKNVGSICSVGWISLENSQVVDSGYSLIDPHCSFSKVNTEVHGISSADVKGAPCFADYWNEVLREKMSTHMVLAHSAAFDMSATEQALYEAGLEDPGIAYMDTLKVLSHFIDAESYKLTDLASSFGIDYNAHNAGEDVRALLYVLFAVCENLGLEDLPALLIRSQIPSENTKTNTFQPKKIDIFDPYSGKKHLNETVEQKSNHLAGKKFCITGDIPGYERSDLERMILEAGGQPTSGVSGKTDFLVVGIYPDYPADFVSSKQKKAIELQSQGKKIQILTSDAFMAMLKE